jgi:transposase-like protein
VANVEIVPRVERRRKWMVSEKAALLAEVEAEGGKVKLVARRHGISESLLYNWRSAWKMAASMHSAPSPEFVALGVLSASGTGAPLIRAQAAPASAPSAAAEDRSGVIEIILGNGTRLRVDDQVNETALLRVLRVLKETA